MAEESTRRLIDEPAGLAFIAIRESYVAICNGDHCAAALLSYFEGWTLWKRDEDYRDPDWIYVNQEEIPGGLLNLWGVTTIKGRLNWLVEIGYLGRRKNPANKFDHRYQYRFDADAVQAGIDECEFPIRQNRLIEGSEISKRFGASVESNGQNQPSGAPEVASGVDESGEPDGQNQPVGAPEVATRSAGSVDPLYIESFLDFLLRFLHEESSSSSPLDAARENGDDDDDPRATDHPAKIVSVQTRAPLFAHYRDNIGTDTPVVRVLIEGAVQKHGEEAVRAAIARAAEYGGRSWRYVSECLESTRSPEENSGLKYIRGEYAEWVKH